MSQGTYSPVFFLLFTLKKLTRSVLSLTSGGRRNSSQIMVS